MFANLLRGALAGAAGTTALNAATYVDMATRARPASEKPQEAVEKVSEQAGVPVPGEGEQRQNRITGLGSLTGIATGVGIGAAVGLLRPLVARVPVPLGAVALGAAAMTATDVPMAKLRLTDVSQWSTADWLSDAVPHLAYGLVTQVALRQMGRRQSA
jgi:hypothetical protein